MTSDANGWPDKPGVPMNPTKPGPHWLRLHGHDEPDVFMWWPKGERWTTLGGDYHKTPMALAAVYLAPALTPDEALHHTRAAAAAWLAARDACVRACNFHGDTLTQHWLSASGVPVTRACATILANLSPPADAAAALAEVVKRAKEEERASIIERARGYLSSARHFGNQLAIEDARARGEGGE